MDPAKVAIPALGDTVATTQVKQVATPVEAMLKGEVPLKPTVPIWFRSNCPTMPATGTEVAAFVPEPLVAMLPPVGTVRDVTVPLEPNIEATPPPPEPQAPAVVVSRPPVPACTQSPGVNAESVTLVPMIAVKVPAAAADPPIAGGEAR